MNREALVVGINRYPFLKDTPTSQARHLRTPAEDAEAIAKILETYGNFRVERLPTCNQDGAWRVDPNPAPRQLVKVTDLKEAIAKLFNPPSQSIPDTAVLFFAGHGLRDRQGGVSEGFLATSEACPAMAQWGVSLRWLRELLQSSPVRQQIVWLDCCYSGELLNFDEADPGNLGIARDRCLISASREFEVAYEEFSGNHGVLTNALLSALNPEQHPDGWVTNYSLVDFIRKQLQTSRQRPIFHNIGSEIILTGKKEKIDHAVLMAGVCPYKGLTYFDFNQEDPKYFYGRTALTDQLLEKVRNGNFLAVLGASGSGKSSVVRAGLLHQLKLGQRLGGSDQWVIRIFRPGEHPLESLAMAFAKDESFNTYLKTRLTNAINSLNQGAVGLKSLIQTTARDRRLVLVVDQFEEAFTLCQDEAQRKQFFDCLLGALEITNNQLCVILTMRADFFGKCAEQDYAGLASFIQEHLVTVTPMNQKELEQAITEPAKKVGLEVQRELVAQMLSDVEGPGSLPLLEYTLTEMWRQRQVDRLMLAEYSRLGAVKGTLQKRADEVYQSLSAEEKLTAKRIFLELTQLGEGTEDTRRQVFKTDLVNEQQSAALVEEVLSKLADARLVVTSELKVRGEGENTVTVVDVAHEALIRHWSLLRHWLNENREVIRRERKIEDAAEEWQRQGKPHDMAFLLQGAKLIEAESFLQDYADLGLLSGLAQEFIRVSQAERKRLEREKEEQLKREQERSAALERALNQAEQALNEGSLLNQAARVRDLLPLQPIEGLLLAIQATGLNRERLPGNILSRVKDALLRGIEITREQNILKGHEDEVTSVAISPNGQFIVSGSQDKTIRLWDTQGKPIGQPIQGHEGSVTSVAISLDSQLIASGSQDRTIRLWDNQGNPIGKPFQRHEDRGLWAKLFLLLRICRRYWLQTISWFLGVLVLDVILWGMLFYALNLLIQAIPLKWIKNQSVILEWFALLVVLLFLAIFLFRVFSFIFKREGSVTAVAFSSDGKYIVSGSQDKTLRLWNQRGKLIGAPVYGHKGGITSVAFSLDGKYIVSGSQDKTLRLLNRWGKLIGASSQGHDSPVTAVTFSPDGKYIVSGSQDKTIRLWDCQGHKKVGLWQKFRLLLGIGLRHWWKALGGFILSFIFIFIGLLAALSKPLCNVDWEKPSKEIAKLPGAGCYDTLFWVSLLIALLCALLVVYWIAWSILKENIVIAPIGKPFEGHRSDVTAVAISPDGQTIISGSGDGTVCLWDRQDNSIRQPLVGHRSDVTAVAISRDGQFILSGSSDKTVRLWDGKDNPIGQRLLQQESSVNTIAISPDGQTIVSGSGDNQVRLWDRQGNPIGQTLRGHEDVVAAVTIASDRQTIVSGSWDNTVRLWDRQGNPIGQPLREHEDRVAAVAISPDGQTIVSGSWDKTLRIWDRQGNPIGQPLRGHEDAVTSVAISSDGQYILSGSWDKTLRMWDRQGNPIGQPLRGHEDLVTVVAISLDGQTIVSGSRDNTVRLWDIQGTSSSQTLRGHEALVTAIAISPDGQIIVSGSQDKTLRMWDRQGNPIGQPLRGHKDWVNAIAISPDGKYIFSGSADKTIWLWEANWESWLQVACNSLRDHPILKNPETDEAKQVCEICQSIYRSKV